MSKIIKTVIVLVITLIIYMPLYLDLKHNLDVSPIEIRNECSGGVDKIVCNRKFDVPTYVSNIKDEFNKIPKNNTIVEKLAGVSPEFFRYSLGFTDNSVTIGWKGQNTIPIEKSLKNCPFTDNLKVNNNVVTFQTNFPFYDIPVKLQQLATALNDCSEFLPPLPKGVDRIDRTEKYSISITPDYLSYVSLLILALSATSLALGIFNVIYKFIVKDLGN